MTEDTHFDPLICVTCRQPITPHEKWSWLKSGRREPEHDKCYDERFARIFPNARKVGSHQVVGG